MTSINPTGRLLYASPVGKTHVNVGMAVGYSVKQADGTWAEKAQTIVQFALPQNHAAANVLLNVKSGAIISVTAGAFFLKTYTRGNGDEVTALELRQVRQVSLVAVSTFTEKVGAGKLQEVEQVAQVSDLVDNDVPM